MNQGIEKELIVEAAQADGHQAKDLEIWDNLNSLFPRLFVDSQRRMTANDMDAVKVPNWTAIEMAYITACNRLNGSRAKQALRTTAEYAWKKRLSEITRTPILNSVWIGRYCVDLFIPGMIGRRDWITPEGRPGQGIIIEIDGPIHDSETKQKKDQGKYYLIHKLGIMLWSLPNSPRGNKTLQSLEGLKYSVGGDHRARVRMWRRIWLITIASHTKIVNVRDICTTANQISREVTDDKS